MGIIGGISLWWPQFDDNSQGGIIMRAKPTASLVLKHVKLAYSSPLLISSNSSHLFPLGCRILLASLPSLLSQSLACPCSLIHLVAREIHRAAPSMPTSQNGIESVNLSVSQSVSQSFGGSVRWLPARIFRLKYSFNPAICCSPSFGSSLILTLACLLAGWLAQSLVEK